MALQSSITVPANVAKKFRGMNKKYEPRMSRSGFIEELMENYEKTHCPECNSPLPIQTASCTCSGSEKL